MADTLIKYTVFIASPGDVKEEREIVRNICEELNKNHLVKNKGITLETIGWEDTMPQAGDPREIINQLAAQCDLLICLFHKRFGSPTASKESGTLEEFLNAYEKWKEWKKPQIMLYFKQIIMDADEWDDPGIKKIAQLKKQIKINRWLLFADFTGTDEFKTKLRTHLEQWISKLSAEAQPVNIQQRPVTQDKHTTESNKPFIKKQVPGNKKLRILHISDLHIRKEDTGSNIRQFDRHLLFDPFLARLKEDYTEHQLQPELVIVSGDIAFQGDKTEYTQAAGFFREILDTLQLPAERLYLVPGNHDVSRKIYRPSDIPQYTDLKQLNAELANKTYRNLLFAGLEEYFTFQQTHYPHLRIIDENLVPFVNLYPSVIGNIALVGLNSAWMCRKSPDREEIAIGEYQVKHAFNAVKGYKDVRLLIYIFHHSPAWLWPPDRKVCEGYFNHALCLTGHLHDTAGYRLEGLQSDFLHLQAGGLYLDKGSTDKDPARYQYLTIDGESGQLRLDFRCFDDEYKRWTIDTRRGKDGRKEFALKEYL